MANTCVSTLTPIKVQLARSWGIRGSRGRTQDLSLRIDRVLRKQTQTKKNYHQYTLNSLLSSVDVAPVLYLYLRTQYNFPREGGGRVRGAVEER